MLDPLDPKETLALLLMFQDPEGSRDTQVILVLSDPEGSKDTQVILVLSDPEEFKV